MKPKEVLSDALQKKKTFLFFFIFGNQNIKNISVSSFIITLLLVRLFMEYMSNKYNLANYFDIYDSRFLVSMLVAIAFSIYVISYFISLYGFRQKLR